MRKSERARPPGQIGLLLYRNRGGVTGNTFF
jgi:hypothetical protein